MAIRSRRQPASSQGSCFGPAFLDLARVSVAPIDFVCLLSIACSARGGGLVDNQPRDGGWDLRGKRSTTGGRIERWMIIVFDSENGTGPRQPGFPLQAVQNTVTQFANACRDFGMQFQSMQPTIFHAGDTMDVRGAFIQCATRAGFGTTNPPQLVVTFVCCAVDDAVPCSHMRS